MSLFDLDDCTVTRSKRRSIALRVGPEGSIEIKAPLKCSDKDILDVLVKHQDWLRKRLLKHQEIQEEAHWNTNLPKAKTFSILGVRIL